MATFAAIYENGVLHPDRPLALAEGARVELTIVPIQGTLPPAGPAMPHPKKTPAEFLAEIASLPLEPFEGKPFSSEDHDEILYGEEGAR